MIKLYTWSDDQRNGKKYNQVYRNDAKTSTRTHSFIVIRFKFNHVFLLSWLNCKKIYETKRENEDGGRGVIWKYRLHASRRDERSDEKRDSEKSDVRFSTRPWFSSVPVTNLCFDLFELSPPILFYNANPCFMDKPSSAITSNCSQVVGRIVLDVIIRS